MSNSPLISYTKLSPNKTSPRNHVIDTITIHCVVGQCTVEALGNVFASPSRKASSNYGIGKDGRIALYVDEADRSWCSGGYEEINGVKVPIKVNGISGSDNDHRAITIEVASDTVHPYKVTDKAYAALIDLCADICKRNNIKELKWKGDKSLVGQIDKQNMTVHRWFANKACPGDYLYERHSAIVSAVNAKIGKYSPDSGNVHINENITSQTVYKVQCGAFTVKANATILQKKLKANGFSTYIVQIGKYWKVQIGAYKVKANAEAMLKKLQAKGFGDAFITYSRGTVEVSTEIKVGDKVKVLKALTYDGKAFNLYHSKYDVLYVQGDKLIIGIDNIITASIHKDNVQKI